MQSSVIFQPLSLNSKNRTIDNGLKVSKITFKFDMTVQAIALNRKFHMRSCLIQYMLLMVYYTHGLVRARGLVVVWAYFSNIYSPILLIANGHRTHHINLKHIYSIVGDINWLDVKLFSRTFLLSLISFFFKPNTQFSDFKWHSTICALSAHSHVWMIDRNDQYHDTVVKRKPRHIARLSYRAPHSNSVSVLHSNGTCPLAGCSAQY